MVGNSCPSHGRERGRQSIQTQQFKWPVGWESGSVRWAVQGGVGDTKGGGGGFHEGFGGCSVTCEWRGKRHSNCARCSNHSLRHLDTIRADKRKNMQPLVKSWGGMTIFNCRSGGANYMVEGRAVSIVSVGTCRCTQ